jgi:hypothetical protein
MKNLVKTVTALCCCAMLAACERPGETAKTALGRSAAVSSSPTDDKNAVSALPEHFDRARTE